MDINVSDADFKINDFVVYPSHGVGQIVDEEVQNIAGFELKMYVITFEKDKMTLKVPKNKIEWHAKVVKSKYHRESITGNKW